MVLPARPAAGLQAGLGALGNAQLGFLGSALSPRAGRCLATAPLAATSWAPAPCSPPPPESRVSLCPAQPLLPPCFGMELGGIRG